MGRAVDPNTTKRAAAFALWMNAPMPMVTIFKTLDVTRLVRAGRKRGRKFNMLLCWCIGRAASRTEEFFLLPVGDRLVQYDYLAVNTVVACADGAINTCDVPFSPDLDEFNQSYLTLTGQVSKSGQAYDLGEDYMVIGTSALAGHEVDGVVNLYAGVYNNPFLSWGKYRKRGFRVTLPISFQFHHTQFDGVPAARFLDRLQEEIDRVRA